MYNIYVCKVKNIRPAPNADRLNLCEVFGNTTVVDKSVNEHDLYLYLPTDGQISIEFGTVNDLFRRKDSEGNPAGGFIDPDKRNIRAISIRGNRSDGLVLPLTTLSSFGDTNALREGDIVSVFNGHVIAEKYIPSVASGSSKTPKGQKGKTTKSKELIAPLFKEHIDTAQLAYNLADFHTGDLVEITRKLHGTSQRTAHLPTLKGYTRTFWDWLFRRPGKPIYEYDYISGTRHTVLESWDGGFYGDNAFRKHAHDAFVGKLRKGEEVYYEIIGNTDDGKPIMGSGAVPKEYQKRYGKTMTFSYGCDPTGETAPKNDFYVYRMTLTTPEGFVIEYDPSFMRYRCEQMGVKTVPIEWYGFIPAHCGTKDDDTVSPGEWIKAKAEEFYDGPEPIDPRHVREGVVVRILNRPTFVALKHKNYLFKCVSGVISEKAQNVMSQDIAEEM